MLRCIPRIALTNRFLLTVLVTGFASVATPAWGQVINEYLKFLPKDGADGDFFGQAIAIDNGIIAVGAPYDDNNDDKSGSAYLFDTAGTQIVKLLPNDGADRDRFGISIAIDNGIVAVGAHGDDDNGFYSGSAYLFDAATGDQIAKLLPNDGAEYDRFGQAIAIDDGIVAVAAPVDDENGGASGSAYLFDADTGTQIAKLLPNDGAAGDFFGWWSSIAIDNGIVAVGAPGNNDNGQSSGSAYLFDISTGAQLVKLLPNDGTTGDQFGYSIDIDNGIVAVGAMYDDDNGVSSGSAYLFDAATGTQIAKLLPSDGAANHYFGNSVTIDNGIVAVGAHHDDDNGSGSAYLFDAATGTQIAKLLSSDGAVGDWFGHSLAIDNDIIVVGASQNHDNGATSGAGYAFNTADIPSCLWDLDGNGIIDTSDLLALFAQWGTDGPADFDESGAVGTPDLLILFANWGPCE